MTSLLEKLKPCFKIQTHPMSHVMPQTLVKEGVYIECDDEEAESLIADYVQLLKEEKSL